MVLLFRTWLLLRERPRHADDLDAPVAEVVGLLGIERQDAVGDLRVRDDERRHGAQAELLRRGKPVPAVRRGEPVLAGDRDDRIEEHAHCADRVRQSVGMDLREVTLELGRLDRAQRQAREDERRAAVRILVRRERRAARLRDALHQVGDARVAQIDRALARLRPTRCGGPALAGTFLDGLLGRRLLRRHAGDDAVRAGEPEVVSVREIGEVSLERGLRRLGAVAGRLSCDARGFGHGGGCRLR